LHRSHRRNVIEVARSWFGSYPYRCFECQHRCFRTEPGHLKSHEAPSPAKPDKRPELTRRFRQRARREIMLYALAIATFVAFLYYIVRAPAP
jgi:hypothetical protein